jgi:hypothetical protein
MGDRAFRICYQRQKAQRNKVIDHGRFCGRMDEPQSQVDIVQESPWLVHYDGAWGITGAGAAAILTSPFEIKLCYVAKPQFTGETDKCTNNITEYEAILLCLQKLRAISVQTYVLHIDSKVVSG